MNIVLATSCGLPFPPVKGSAVAQLWLNLALENEKRAANELFIISSYDKEAELEAKKFNHTHVIYIRPNNFISFFDKIVNYFFKIIFNKEENCNYLWKLYVIKKTKKILLKNNFDKLVFQNAGFILRCLKNKEISKKYKNNIFYHLHNDIPDKINIKYFKMCKSIVVSDYLNEKIRKICDNKAPESFTLKNCINISNFSNKISNEEKNSLKKSLGIDLKKNLIIFVGRIQEYKGIGVLIDTFSKLKGDFALLICGSSLFGIKTKTAFEEEIKNKISKIENIYFTGYIPNSEIYKYYQIADLAVLPSLWEEPAGLTIIEAMSSGIPVITTISGGIPEYLLDFGTYVERDGKIVDSLANKIYDIFENYDLFKNKALEAQKFAIENYDIDKYYDNFIKIMSY